VAATETRGPGFLADVGIARVAAVALMIVGAVALQSTLLVKLTIAGVIPQLVLVVIVSIAFIEGPRVGAVTGFFGGLLVDLLIPQSIVGISCLVFTLVAYAVGTFRIYAPSDSVWVPLLAVAMSSAVAEGGYAGLAVILGEPWVSINYTIRIIGLVTLYDCLLTPFTYPLVRKVASRVRPEKVYRW
jgi:rod shape-determining protein MreD